MKDENNRLKTEAEFQNARTKGDSFKSRRSKFYYLNNEALKFFQKVSFFFLYFQVIFSPHFTFLLFFFNILNDKKDVFFF